MTRTRGRRDAWKESRRRTAVYTKDDWIAIKSESAGNIQEVAGARAAGEPAAGTVAMDLAEAHRQHISRWFYDCRYGLAEMYVADPRFTASYDEVAPGLAHYVHDAILANADRARGA